MIIQKVVKGVANITTLQEVQKIFNTGIGCNLWTYFGGSMPTYEIPLRLTETNLDWHQNRYDEPYPNPGDPPFHHQTPFISTTAGTIERDALYQKNTIHSAKDTALKFATRGWQVDGCLFYCYVFILGKKAVGHQQFAEELRELNIYEGYSPFQPEGEITAKIIIPPAQIEYAEVWSVRNLKAGPLLVKTWKNSAFYLPPEEFHNIRNLL